MNTLSREERIAQGPPTQADYEAVVDEIATIRMQKVLSYGEDRYTTNPEEQEHHLDITYSDIYRKFIRIKEFMGKGLKNRTAPDGESLRDALLDLANYAIMGVQQLDHLTIPKVDPVFKIDQIAFSVPDHLELVKTFLNRVFNTELEWFQDTVQASGVVKGEPGSNEASLNFNYQIMSSGLELELLRYDSGPNWLEGRPGLSHLGIHVEDLEPIKARLVAEGMQIVQEVETSSHTNPHIADSRRYRYVIFNTRDKIGFDLKLIQRIPK